MFRKAMLGDTATLNLDFTTGVLDSRLTFTRAAGTATYINSSGYVTTAAANTPRFDYDPATLAPRGLLIEGQGTNLCAYSQAIAGAGWTTTTGYTVTTNTTDLLSPAGDNTATKLVYTSGYARCIQIVALAANTTYTMSYWIKSVGTHTFRVYDLTAGADIASSIGSIPVTSSWTRVQKTFTTGASTSSCWFYVATDGGPTAGMTAYVWGCQVEAGSGASSYIPTVASQVTRNADECTATGSNFSSWWPLSQSAFTVYWDGDISRSPANTQFYWLTRAGGSSRSRGYVTTGSLIRANNTAYDFTMSPTTSMTVGTRFRSAVAISSGSSAMYANNSTVTGSDTSAGAVTLFDADSLNFNPNAENFMHIRAFKFYNTRLTNAELLALVS